MASRPQNPTPGGPRRPQSAASHATSPRVAAARRPQSAAARRGADAVADVVQAHLKARVPLRADSAGRSEPPGGAVPGFEMSGVTAQDLQGAGILYAAEAKLLQGQPKAELPPPLPAQPAPPGDQRAAGAPTKSKVCLDPPPPIPILPLQNKPMTPAHRCARLRVAVFRSLSALLSVPRRPPAGRPAAPSGRTCDWQVATLPLEAVPLGIERHRRGRAHLASTRITLAEFLQCSSSCRSCTWECGTGACHSRLPLGPGTGGGTTCLQKCNHLVCSTFTSPLRTGSTLQRRPWAQACQGERGAGVGGAVYSGGAGLLWRSRRAAPRRAPRDRHRDLER